MLCSARTLIFDCLAESVGVWCGKSILLELLLEDLQLWCFQRQVYSPYFAYRCRNQSEEYMFFWDLSVIVSWLLDILEIAGLADSEKDLELLILRHQINILERQVKHPRVSRLEKLSIAVTVNKLRRRAGRSRQQLTRSVLIFKPETVLGCVRSKNLITSRELATRPCDSSR